MIDLESISLQTATYVKLQPQSEEFLDISNPKAVLERALRTFACLSVGDMIAINYNNKQYEMNVLELKPANAVSIIECDMNVSKFIFAHYNLLFGCRIYSCLILMMMIVYSQQVCSPKSSQKILMKLCFIQYDLESIYNQSTINTYTPMLHTNL